MVTRILIILFALTLSASAQRICPPNQVNRNGLVGRWLVPGKQTGNVATPTLCLDDSGKGNHGTVVSNANYGIIFSRPAMTFNGSSQYVSTSQNSTFSATTPFTISVWVSCNSSNSCIIVNTAAEQSPYSGIWTSWSGGAVNQKNVLPFSLVTDGSNEIGVKLASQLSLNTLYQVAFTYDGSKTQAGMKIYVNGVSRSVVVSGTLGTFTTLTSTPWRIGTDTSSSHPDYFSGSLDDVRIYNRALSAAEIRAIYQGEQ